MDNHFNKVFPSFVPLHPEFFPGHKVIDISSSQFSFYLSSKCKDDNFKARIQQLDNLAIEYLSILLHALVITDTSVKNIMSTEAELFTIRCDINQATNSNDDSKII